MENNQVTPKIRLLILLFTLCLLYTSCEFGSEYKWENGIENGVELFGDFRYRIDNGSIKITRYEGSGGMVVIPAEIDGIPVTTIGWHSFRETGLTDIIIPDSITAIDYNAFSHNKLTNVILPNSITYFGSNMFANNQLENVDIPDGITSIAIQMFYNNKLIKVTIPESVKNIMHGAFCDNKLTSVSFSTSITSIGSYAFRNNQLSNVIIPDNVTLICDNAFVNNPITSITIGADAKLDEHSFSKNDQNRFVFYYNEGGKLAGTYTRANTNSTVWLRQ